MGNPIQPAFLELIAYLTPNSFFGGIDKTYYYLPNNQPEYSPLTQSP